MYNNFPIQLKIEGVSGDSYQADIAIDDITIQDGSCGGVPPSPSLPPIPPTTQGPGKEYHIAKIPRFVTSLQKKKEVTKILFLIVWDSTILLLCSVTPIVR